MRTDPALCGAETRSQAVRWRRRRRVGPGLAGPLLQGEELSLPPQSTLLSVPLQSGWVSLRGWNKATAGSAGATGRWRGRSLILNIWFFKKNAIMQIQFGGETIIHLNSETAKPSPCEFLPLCVPLRSPLVPPAPVCPGKRFIWVRSCSSSWHTDVLLPSSHCSAPAVRRRWLALRRDIVLFERDGGRSFYTSQQKHSPSTG